MEDQRYFLILSVRVTGDTYTHMISLEIAHILIMEGASKGASSNFTSKVEYCFAGNPCGLCKVEI